MSAPGQSAGGVVLVGERVVVLRKRLNQELRLPKGRLESGETPAQAALREVAEETGFADLGLVRLLGEREIEYRNGASLIARRTTWFQMRLVSTLRCSRDRRDALRFAVLWLPATQALDELSFEDEREFLRRALSAGEPRLDG